MLIATAIKYIPEDTFAQCRIEAESMWQEGKPCKWYLSIPVILVWIMLVFLIIKLIVG
jgi:hypothetical protein